MILFEGERREAVRGDRLSFNLGDRLLTFSEVNFWLWGRRLKFWHCGSEIWPFSCIILAPESTSSLPSEILTERGRGEGMTQLIISLF